MNQKQRKLIDDALENGFIKHETPYRAWTPDIYEIVDTEWKISFEESTPLFFPTRYDDRCYNVSNLPKHNNDKKKKQIITEIKNLFNCYINEEECNMKFYNKISDTATRDKKSNVFYWDAIDHLSEDYVQALIEFSTEKVSIYEDDYDEIMALAKEVTEFATNLLKERVSAEFPYIDENY